MLRQVSIQSLVLSFEYGMLLNFWNLGQSTVCGSSAFTATIVLHKSLLEVYAYELRFYVCLYKWDTRSGEGWASCDLPLDTSVTYFIKLSVQSNVHTKSSLAESLQCFEFPFWTFNALQLWK